MLPRIYTDETAARRHLERLQWPDGPICPHCGNADPDRIVRLKGESTRAGVLKCYECQKPFSVTVGTVFERSHIPLNKWLYATHLLTASKKGMSAHQLHRTLGVTYKTAWFMAHRIREAMRDANPGPLGGPGKIVEADETYIADSEKKIYAATRKRNQVRPTKNVGPHYKRKVMALVERGGQMRSFHIDEVTAKEITPIIRQNVSRESDFMTDEGRHYRQVGQEFASHERVHHTAKEYVRGAAHVNTAEGFFSIFKRGMKGIYQHCGEQHLHRYLVEFDFRYNNRAKMGVDDTERAARALKGIKGKRLTYRTTDEATHAAASSWLQTLA
jgi:transposase-like protein